MVFSSSVFLFAFLPMVLLVYFALPWRPAKNTALLLASFLFYSWGEPVYVLLMVMSILVNWLFGIVVGREGLRHRKLLLVLAVLFNCLVIGFFKYEGFLAANINALLGSQIVPDLHLPLPIGISFYTLQALSYVIDVYRCEVDPQRNPLYLGMYIACFPQLIAGPIVRYRTIQEQVVGRKETFDDFANGMRLFVVGLAKKVLLANNVALLATKMLEMGGAQIGAVGAWAGLAAYTFQIFFDFSGYSDMAIGLGRMMGFKYLRNFNYPYISQSITEFWRRWHISLSSFFRDYVYIPLGGSRCSTTRWVFNIAVVWMVTGIWHGAAWNYVCWGIYYGVLLIGEKLVWGKALERAPQLLRHVYTIAVFMFGWSFFWIVDSGQLVEYWLALVGVFGATGASTAWELTAWHYWPLFIVCIIASTPIAPWVKFRVTAWVEGRKPGSFFQDGIVNVKHVGADELCAFEANCCDSGRKTAFLVFKVLFDVTLMVLFLLCCASIVSGSFNPFIYYQF